MTVLTGKSGTGKTTILKASGLPNIFFADEFVKGILYQAAHEVGKQIIKWWPEVEENNMINTKRLGKILFNNDKLMYKVSTLIKPFVKEWIRNLPSNSIVEMAGYINYEKDYKDSFNKVILIEKDKKDLSKFDHIENMAQPINNAEIKVNHVIKNNGHIADAVIELKMILNRF